MFLNPTPEQNVNPPHGLNEYPHGDSLVRGFRGEGAEANIGRDLSIIDEIG